jgi:hypothetical protein
MLVLVDIQQLETSFLLVIYDIQFFTLQWIEKVLFNDDKIPFEIHQIYNSKGSVIDFDV